MPAAASIIGQCTECCACPTPEVPGFDYQLTYTSRSGDLGCVGANLSGSVDYEDVTYEDLTLSGTLTLTSRETKTASGSGSWNYYTGGSVSSSSSRTIEIPPAAPTTTTGSATYTDCTVGIAGPGAPPDYSSAGEAGATNLLWEYRAADLIVATDPGTGIGYSRFRTYYNPTTLATQNVYGSGAGPGSPWILVYDREKTASGSISGQTVTGVIEGDVGTDECAVTETGDEVGVSVSVEMDVFGQPDTTYVITVVYEDTPTASPAEQEDFEVTTDSDGLATLTFAIKQPNGGVTRCIDTITARATTYIVRFRVPLSGCYSASWTITDSGGSGTTSETWDGVIPSGYDRDDPLTWPFFGPYDLAEGESLSDFESDCTCP